MKILLASLPLVVAGFFLSACETDMPPKPPAEPRIIRGLTGGGTTVPYDRPNDPMIRETSYSVQ